MPECSAPATRRSAALDIVRPGFDPSVVLKSSRNGRSPLHTTLVGLVALFTSGAGFAGNPILPGADPHVVVVGKTAWLYPTWNDGKSGESFFAFSSTNLTTWERHGPLLRLADVPWVASDGAPWHGAWAPSVFQRDGRWFLYYSVGPQHPTPSRLGVATADSPQGPFRDSGQPLLTGGNGFEAIDPMAFRDPRSGKTFLYAGGSAGAKLRVFELRPDGLGFAREVPVETPPKFTEGAFMHYANRRYYLSYSHGSYQRSSYSVHYATSSSPTGPWKYQGPILESDATRKGPGHHAIFPHPATGATLIAYHRWENQTGDGPYRGSRYVCIEPLRYRRGKILPVEMTGP